jgi:AbiU2
MSRPGHLPIDERLETAAQLVLRSRKFLDIWLYFESKDTRPAIIDTLNCFSEFFRIDIHAHFVAFIVHIAALFDKRKDSINLPDLATELKQSNLISAQAAAADVDALLSQADKVAPKVHILRSNLFAHRSATLPYDGAFKKAAITPGEMRDLTEIALKIVNHLLLARGLRDHFFNELPRQDAEAILKTLREAQRL